MAGLTKRLAGKLLLGTALAAGLGVSATAFSPAAVAQQSEAPQVTEDQVNRLLDAIYNNKGASILNPSVFPNYSTMDFLRQTYATTAHDTTKAMIVACIAMGCVQESDNRINQVHYFVDPTGPVQVFVDYEYNRGLKDLQTVQVTYDDRKMTFGKEIALIATDLLDSAYNKHKIGFNEYMNQFFIPYQTANRTGIAIQNAARLVGLGNTTVAMSSRRQP